MNFPPFDDGQVVIAVNAMDGSYFKNGNEYTVSTCEYKESGNPISPIGKKYWYVGIVGHANGGAFFRPGVFVAKSAELVI